MKIKTSELTGAALDYAVSIAKGHESKPLPYSTSWHLMGPIIEDELIMLDLGMDSRIALIKRHTDFMDRLEEFLADGPDYLEAAAKCYVMSVYGYTVDIPDAAGINMNEAITKMKATPGRYLVSTSDLASEGYYTAVEVTEDGTIHQLNSAGQRDGVLNDSGWREDAVVKPYTGGWA